MIKGPTSPPNSWDSGFLLHLYISDLGFNVKFWLLIHTVTIQNTLCSNHFDLCHFKKKPQLVSVSPQCPPPTTTHLDSSSPPTFSFTTHLSIHYLLFIITLHHHASHSTSIYSSSFTPFPSISFLASHPPLHVSKSRHSWRDFRLDQCSFTMFDLVFWLTHFAGLSPFATACPVTGLSAFVLTM